MIKCDENMKEKNIFLIADLYYGITEAGSEKDPFNWLVYIK